MTFPCTKCGLCCQNIAGVELLEPLDRGDGVCTHFVEGEGCSIYEQRPIFCRIDEGYEVFASSAMSHHVYTQKNAEVCNSLQEAAGMDSIYRVNL